MFLFGPIGPTELIIMLIFLLPYFLPSIIAFTRKHHNSAAILILNIFLGWTLIGWIIALVWSFTAAQNKSPTQSPTPAENRFCSKCGASLGSDASYCRKCGAKIDT